MSDYDTMGGGAAGAVTGATSGIMAGAGLAKAGMVAGPVGMIVGGLLGAVFGSKKKKVAKPPTYEQMMNTNLNAQANIQNRLLDLETQYRPKYQGLQEQTLNTQLYGGQGTSGYIDMLNKSNTALLGVQSGYAQNYMNTLGGLTAQARGIIESPQNAAMHARMMADAQRDLSLGSQLNEDDQRMAFQNANMGMAQRGLTGRQGVAAGVMANYSLGQQRLGERRSFASAMMGAETGLQNAALQASQGAMAGYGAGGAFMGQANQMLGQYQPQIFQPESQMGMQAQGMQYQHNAAMARASLQNRQNALSSVGQLGAFMIQNPSAFGAPPPPAPTTSFGNWMSNSSSLPTIQSPTFSNNPLMQGVQY